MILDSEIVSETKKISMGSFVGVYIGPCLNFQPNQRPWYISKWFDELIKANIHPALSQVNLGNKKWLLAKSTKNCLKFQRKNNVCHLFHQLQTELNKTSVVLSQE